MSECPNCGFQLTPSNMHRAKRLPADWICPTEWHEWARKERPDVNSSFESGQFRDFWCAKAGKDAAKLDWFATWRNWIRNAKASAPRAPEQKRQPIYKAETKGKPVALGSHLEAIARDLGITK